MASLKEKEKEIKKNGVISYSSIYSRSDNSDTYLTLFPEASKVANKVLEGVVLKTAKGKSR